MNHDSNVSSSTHDSTADFYDSLLADVRAQQLCLRWQQSETDDIQSTATSAAVC